jgi:hypothetical protein
MTNHRTALLLALLLASGLVLAQPATESKATLEAPASVPAGNSFEVKWTGPGAAQDFISIDAAGAPDTTYGDYAYPSAGNPITLKAPDAAGQYVVRYHLAGAYTVIGAAPIEVTDVSASIEAPGSAPVGSPVTIKWSGPNQPQDFIAIDRKDAPDRTYGPYVYTKDGGPAEITAPDEPGEYVVRYHMGSSYRVIGSTPLTLTSSNASIEVPESIAAGATLEVKWTGPDQPRDFLSIDRKDAPDKTYGPYAYTSEGSPATIKVPDEPGDYVVRYHMASSYRVLGSAALRVDDVAATLDAPASAPAGTRLKVGWKAPGTVGDFISIDKPADPPKTYGPYALTSKGNPVSIETPKETGTYELRYHMGSSYRVLGTRPLEITPGAPAKPGKLRVVAGADQPGIGYRNVEVVLDASGSMLQRLGAERRIEIARKALLDLAGEALPDDTNFALRVFGESAADLCASALAIPLATLDRTAAIARIQSVKSINGAKTPIGDSLRLVKDDLANAAGPTMVVLVTDGEETCGGDPLAAIGELRNAGVDVRVSIVGFAVAEPDLKRTFQHWAESGGGAYVDAQDGAALASALRTSFAPRFEVRSAEDLVASGVVGGAAIELAAGSYTVRVMTEPPKDVTDVQVESEQERTVTY